jgi:hypothetical protein
VWHATKQAITIKKLRYFMVFGLETNYMIHSY